MKERPFGPSMNQLSILASAGAAVAVAAAAVIGYIRSRTTPEQREMLRRQRICELGRITDGTLLDVCEIDSGGSSAHMLLYSYQVAGVRYECSQEVTHLGEHVDMASCQVGSTTSVRYDPRHPGNSIVVAESWSGLRR
jgi:hypothetical protein